VSKWGFHDMLFGGSGIDALTNVVNSPPGVMAAGIALGGLFWKAFKSVGDVLNLTTNLQIAVWLLDHGGHAAKSWRSTFQRALDDFLGASPLQTKGFWPVCLVLFVMALINFRLAAPPISGGFGHASRVIAVVFLGVASRTYSAFVRRGIVRHWSNAASRQDVFWTTLFLVAFDFLCGVLFALLVVTFSVWGDFGEWLRQPMHTLSQTMPLVPRLPFLILPFTIVSVTIMLYWTSGMIINAATAFDRGFAWFTTTFDVENKPLQSIGVVAGTLVTIVYWVVAVLVAVLM
jgi:hypothetical protein